MSTTETWHGTAGGYRTHKCRCEACKATRAKYDAAYYERNRDRILARKVRTYDAASSRRYHAARVASGEYRQWQYGITQVEFENRMSAQGHSCAVCRTEFGEDAPHIDHDHSCCAGPRSCGECIRGFLCGRCNRGLGMFMDDPDRLVSAIEYLRGGKQ